MAPNQVQFIIDPCVASHTASSVRAQRSLARSHAARSAHARARRMRTIQYQAQKAQDSSSDSPRHLDESPTSVLSYHRRDPFRSYARSLNPIEEMLLDHYTTAIVPAMTCNAFDVDFYRRVVTAWVPHALHEPGLPAVLLLASSRHLFLSYNSQQQQEQQQLYSRLTYMYKLQLLGSLREAISTETPTFSDTTIIKAIMLAYDEVWVNDEESLKRHVEGALKMVSLKGGPHTLGLDGLVERLLFNLVAKVDPIVGLSVTSPWDPRICSMEIASPHSFAARVEVA
ncbi:hypothetical protein BDV12DRAFT_173266 [Aspergillus spectabilis]